METRNSDLFELAEDLELRFAEGDQPNRLVGYAAVFNSLSRDLGGFKERINAGAFRDSISGGDDIRALVSHDPAMLLGRTSNGTLRVAEDERGLRVEIDLPPGVSYAEDIRQLVQRRDIRGMSFGFKVREGGQRFSKEGGQTIRELRSLNLREVSVTATPAYDQTSLSLRVDPAALELAKAVEKFPRIDLAKRKLVLHSIF